ncbi:hypothetical protein FOQG_16908 [Fusarium oxysporum f. sp. raphani 54005]|uniref:Uncharacterized protein n=3 Tax=Fusarium oxysporum TaxID=5507 RepID=X0C6Q8_FUSOX|nr:hypothetical protein FOQG_16908 [Fusarium oxysporum f. sp. raphani 54005]KAF6517547.1 hypothetical protein HZS61_003108 [Fusarium oxysporum f. sp. conglutinans]KAG7410372.1 hypothetical protein Forpi1262_v017533 [Fusarium oxysporum f. sp. raphani]KAI8404328.1 hypothetical protein FOFC_15823 [Fusarium oxysporum]
MFTYPKLGFTIWPLPSQSMTDRVRSTGQRAEEFEGTLNAVMNLPKPTDEEWKLFEEAYKANTGEDFPFSQDEVRITRGT